MVNCAVSTCKRRSSNSNLRNHGVSYHIAKSDKIKIIRQQYDAFLDEDKKRKERNEYILNRLDKMRCCDYIVPYRPKVHHVNDNFITQSYSRYAHIPEPPMENRATRSQMTLSTVDLSIKSIDESMLLKEISKKYILIPKLKNAADNNELLSSNTDVKSSSFDDNDWKSKYDILNQLKQEEKEDTKTPDHVNVPKDKDVHMFASELNEDTIDIHCSPNDKPYYKYDDPVRDNNNFKTKKAGQMLNEEQNCKTDSSQEDFVNSAGAAILAAHRNSIEINKDSESRSKIVEITPERSESIKNNSDMPQNIANAVIAKEQQTLKEVVGIEKNNTQPQINTEKHDPNNVVADQHQLEKDQLYETHSKDCDVTNYAEDEGNVGYAKEDYQYMADPNIAHEQTASTEVVQHVEQNQVYSQGYEQQVPNEYNQTNYAEGENVAYVNQEQEYHGQEYQEQVHQGQEYQGQYATETQGYSNQPQYGQNAIINETYDNTNEQHLMQPGQIDETLKNTYYTETPIVYDNAPIEKTSDGQENEYNSDVINPTQNPDYVEDIQEFELEANLYNNVDPNAHFPVSPVASGIVADESKSQQPISQEDYNIFYEDNQMVQDPLDVNDHDATLQQYDQSYEDQYTGNYEEVPIVENIQVAYEPVQTQELEYEDESLLNIEKTLDNEQGYGIDGDLQNTGDAVPNIVQANEQPNDQSAKQVPAAVKKEMLTKN